MDGVRMGERDSTETRFKGYYRNPSCEKNFLEQWVILDNWVWRSGGVVFLGQVWGCWLILLFVRPLIVCVQPTQTPIDELLNRGEHLWMENLKGPNPGGQTALWYNLSRRGGPGEKGAAGRERWTPSSGEQLAGHKVNVSRQIASDGDHETRWSPGFRVNVSGQLASEGGRRSGRSPRAS